MGYPRAFSFIRCAMEFNRNQFFLTGIVVLLLGFQFRAVDAYVLNPRATKFVAEKFGSPRQQVASATMLPALETVGQGSTATSRTLKPPIWLGWATISIGAVLILHSLAMPRP